MCSLFNISFYNYFCSYIPANYAQRLADGDDASVVRLGSGATAGVSQPKVAAMQTGLEELYVCSIV
jgi:hypothetical protein